MRGNLRLPMRTKKPAGRLPGGFSVLIVGRFILASLAAATRQDTLKASAPCAAPVAARFWYRDAFPCGVMCFRLFLALPPNRLRLGQAWRVRF